MRSLLLAIILALFAALIHAYPTESAPEAAEEQVLTPSGLRPKSQVHFVPPGGSVRHTADAILLIDKDGKVLNSSPITSPAKRSTLEQSFNGWATYAYWYNTAGSPISSFTTSWIVPQPPAANHGQTLFWFNSIEPASGNAILQPVLQWGPSAAGGGAFYCVAVWYVSTSQVYYTTPQQVYPGQDLDGSITLASYSGSYFNYYCFFTNLQVYGLYLQNSPELVWATETLEVYNTVGSADYPHGYTSMYPINLHTLALSTPPVSWSVVNDYADGLTTAVIANGPTNARVDIHYPT